MGAAVAHEENIRQRDERDLERERKKEKEEKQWTNSVPVQNSSEIFVILEALVGFNHFLLYCYIKQKTEMPKAENRELETS